MLSSSSSSSSSLSSSSSSSLLLLNKPRTLPTDFNHPCMELTAYSGKVHNLLWSSQNSRQYLFSCGPEGQMTWWNIKHVNSVPVFIVSPLRSFILPPSKQRWATAIEIFPNPSTKRSSDNENWTAESMLLVCGDRKGSLHLFDPRYSTPSEKVLVKIRFTEKFVIIKKCPIFVKTAARPELFYFAALKLCMFVKCVCYLIFCKSQI